MEGTPAAFEPLDSPHVREASWLMGARESTNVASSGPPIWRWTIPLRRPGIRLRAFLGSSSTDRPTQDALLAIEYPDRLILAVADGVTPTDRTPRIAGVDGAGHAAHTALFHIARAPPDADLARVLTTVNDRLLRDFATIDRADLHPRDRPQTAVVVASVRFAAAGALEAVDAARAADCDLWTRRRSGWTLETPTPLLADGPRQALERWDAANRDAAVQERIHVEKRLLDHPSRWNLAALGRFESPTIESLIIEREVDALVLTSDGADLSRFAPEATMGLTAGLPALESTGTRHHDVAMLHLEIHRDHEASTRYLNT